MQVTVLVGNPKQGSRTRLVAERLVAQLFTDRAALETIDLAEFATQVFDWPSDTMQRLTQTVSESDVVVIASPTYKASYTGLLKAFLDRYPANGLAGVVAVPLFTGADQTHSMAPDVNLVPLLLELGAVVPGRGLYYNMAQHDRFEEIVAEAAARLHDNFNALAAIAQHISKEK